MALAFHPRSRTEAAGGRRWSVLAFVALAQLMVALDATIVSIALPSAQRALHASDAERQWVVTAYTLAFGCLLLVGGRIADSLGRKRAFVAGLAGFAVASAAGGAAPALPVLVGARALQGAFAALLAPTALSLLAVTFTGPRERARAFAVYGTIAGTGAVVGLLLGGVLTQYLDWRWCLYVNVPVAAVAAAGGWLVLGGREPGGGGRRLDIPRALVAGAGLAALISACSQAVTEGWASRTVAGLLALSGLLLAAFLVRDARAARPLLPLRIVRHRARAGVYVTVALAIAGMFGAFLLLTYYLQVVLGFTPLEAGLAFLPMTAAAQVTSWAIASRLMPFVPPRALMAPGALVAAAGMGVLTLVQASGGYLSVVLPAEVLLGAGVSCVMVPAFSTATQGVDPREAGAASAIVNTAQQLGGSIGTALLNTIAAGAAAGFGAAGIAALVHGYSAAAGFGAAILVAASVVAAVMIDAGRPVTRQAGLAPGGTSR
ncbi:MAG: MFS transporter [Chloroflexi bacterium]|nr:MAG: MFS transporter [Chloroflexota bacterium]